MKFKTKEELFDAKYGVAIYNTPEQLEITRAESYDEGLEDAFNSFAERAEFFEKYVCIKLYKGGYEKHLDKMKVEAPELYEEYHEFLKSINNNISKYKSWNTWLYECCFGDVIE